MAKPTIIGVEYICDGIKCGDCDYKEQCREGFEEFPNDEKVMALLRSLKELGLKLYCTKFKDGSIGIWLNEPEKCCDGSNCACKGLPLEPPDMVWEDKQCTG